MNKLKKELNEIKDQLEKIEENTKKPHWFRTTSSFMLLTIGLLAFNLDGNKVLEKWLKEYQLNEYQITLGATALILISLFLHRR